MGTALCRPYWYLFMAKQRQTGTKPKRSIWDDQRNRRFVRFLAEAALAILLAFLAAVFFQGSITIQESSMDPTIQAGDSVWINRLTYRFAGVRRGDLIAYKSRDAQDEVYHIKRVIGIPGDTIQIKDGLIMINGETFLEERELPTIMDPGIAAEPVTLKNNEYFVLGDNRNASEDSRFADVGNIKKSQISGKVWFIASPSSRRGFV